MGPHFWRFSLPTAIGSAALTLALIVGARGVLSGTDGDSVMQGLESELQQVFEKTKGSVVQIKVIVPVRDDSKGELVGEGLSVGTGFFVDAAGHILTTASVLRGADRAVVYWQGKAYEARGVGNDPRTNVALLKIEASTPPLAVENSPTPKTGSMTMVVGYPMDGPLSLEYGFISDPSYVLGLISPQETGQAPQLFATSRIRTSVRVHPGQSGSPLLNRKGEAIGMIIYAMQDGASTFALPMAAARKIQGDLLEFHAPRHGWTGITIDIKSNELRSENQRITVRDVFEDQPGHRAGIRPGDVLRKIGDRDIRTPDDVIDATFYLSIGDTVNFAIERNGKALSCPVKVASRPSDRELMALKPVSFPTTSLR